MKYLETLAGCCDGEKKQDKATVAAGTGNSTAIWDHFGAIALLSSMAPSGHSRVIRRLLWNGRFRDLWKIRQEIPRKRAAIDPALCRDLFVGGRHGHAGCVSDEDLQR